MQYFNFSDRSLRHVAMVVCQISGIVELMVAKGLLLARAARVEVFRSRMSKSLRRRRDHGTCTRFGPCRHGPLPLTRPARY